MAIALIQQFMLSNVTSNLNAYITRGLFSEKQNDQYEKELDRLQMGRLLKWMNMFFNDETESNENKNENKNEDKNENKNEDKNENNENDMTIKQAYRKELFSIYKTISSDYKQYENWKRYNQSLWVFRSYRSKHTNTLAQKILSDLALFHEGMNLFSKS
jgi:hypothetical protein